MPARNAERFVAAAVHSILNQTFQDFEFIVINDGSTDGTSRILNSYTDPRLQLVEREEKGFAFSLNQAISLANGKYLARMDADDISEEDRLERQYSFMEANPETGILGGQAETIDEYGSLIGEMRKPTSWENISGYIEYVCPIIHPTYFVRSEVYHTLGGYRAMPPVEDYDLLLRAFHKGYKMRNLCQTVIKYRMRPSGMSQINPQRSLFLMAKLQRMHKLEREGKVGADEILSCLLNSRDETGFWFARVYRMRNHLLQRRKKRNGFQRYLSLMLVFVVSSLHYQIFMNTYKGYKSLRWNQ